MENQYKIGLIGSGNIGTAMAALLSQSGVEIQLTARGERLAQVSQHGVQLNDRGQVINAQPRVVERLLAPVDALFVCVKSQNLADAIEQNRAAITPSTLVIPMVNGLPFWFFAKGETMGHVPVLDPNHVLERILRPAQVLGAVLLMTVKTDADGMANSSNTPTLSLGPVSSGTDMDSVNRLREILEMSGVRADIDHDIRKKALTKLLANFATNALSALTGALLDEIGQTPQLRAIATGLADEFRSWAYSEGYEMPSNDWLVDLLLDAGPFPTSMLQDALAGKTLETDAICRAPLDCARAVGKDMPVIDALLACLSGASQLPAPRDEQAALLARILPMNIPTKMTA